MIFKNTDYYLYLGKYNKYFNYFVCQTLARLAIIDDQSFYNDQRL
jgi:hypothetical protein